MPRGRHLGAGLLQRRTQHLNLGVSLTRLALGLGNAIEQHALTLPGRVVTAPPVCPVNTAAAAATCASAAAAAAGSNSPSPSPVSIIIVAAAAAACSPSQL
jgi:hypothetical protein